MRRIGLLIAVLLTTTHLNAQNVLTGKWEGGISIPSGQLKIIFKIDKTAEKLTGTLDIPQQGAKGLRFESIIQNGDSVELVFSAGQMRGIFSGVFEDETLISGNYLQGAGKTSFSVERVGLEDAQVDYVENEIEIIILNGEIEIGGTLTLPEEDIKAPLVIMSSGSGAQDRDSNIFDFKMFKVIAQKLAQKGIPSFRYDDRGINKSSGNFANATLDDLVSDVDAIIKYFKNSDKYSFEKFTALGHSQGGIVAGKATVENEDIIQLILMGSTAPSLSEILRYQVGLGYANTPVEQSLIDIEIDARESLMKAIVNDKGIKKAESDYNKAYKNVLNGLPEAQKSSMPDMDGMVQNQTSTLVAAFGSPQMKSLLFYVPTKDLEKVKVPALVLFGGKDTQVTLSQNLESIQKALETSGTTFETITFPEANHLFQKAETGSVSEYSFLQKAFVDTFTDSISSWILNN